MASKAGLKEFRMAYSDRGGVEEYSGAQADARRIQNVLFGHGRAGDYDLGVDIQSYLHEISDATTLDEIRDKIDAAVKKYCPDVVILDMAVDTLSAEEDPEGKSNSSLIVGFSIGTNTGKPFDFAILAQKDSKANVVASLIL